MAEYIDRKTTMDAVNRLVDMTGDAGREKGLRAAVSVLSRLDAADVAPVRHGHWVNLHGKLVCNQCGVFAKWASEGNGFWGMAATNYCPNCGARMDGERRDGDDL